MHSSDYEETHKSISYGNKERRSTSTSKSESYKHLLDEEYLKDESKARVEGHPVEETKV